MQRCHARERRLQDCSGRKRAECCKRAAGTLMLSCGNYASECNIYALLTIGIVITSVVNVPHKPLHS